MSTMFFVIILHRWTHVQMIYYYFCACCTRFYTVLFSLLRINLKWLYRSNWHVYLFISLIVWVTLICLTGTNSSRIICDSKRSTWSRPILRVRLLKIRMPRLLPWRLESSRCRRNSRKSILMTLRYNFSDTVFAVSSLLRSLLYLNCQICWRVSASELCTLVFVCVLYIHNHARAGYVHLLAHVFYLQYYQIIKFVEVAYSMCLCPLLLACAMKRTFRQITLVKLDPDQRLSIEYLYRS